MAHKEGQQHPIKLYLVVWGWLFVLSTCSFLGDHRLPESAVSGFYILAMILLCMHLYHGLWSMFQSLGISHPRYTPQAEEGRGDLRHSDRHRQHLDSRSR